MTGLMILILMLLLLFPKYSVQGAADGLTLWFNVVLPTLAPFMICTKLIAACGGVRYLMKPFAPLLRRIFSVSEDGAYVLFCGILCGYPLGSKLCADFSKEGRISAGEAKYLLSICNHPSPMFLSGYVYSMLPVMVSKPWFLFCFYIPLIPVSLLSRRYYRVRKMSQQRDVLTNTAAGETEDIRSNSSSSSSKASSNEKMSSVSVPLEEILLSVSETMVLIGNYIMLFSIFAEWVGQISWIPLTGKALLSGLLEITTGTRMICKTFLSERAVPIVIWTAAFGGISGIFQTKSMIRSSGDDSVKEEAFSDTIKRESCKAGFSACAGLSIRHYVFWKIIYAFIAAAAWMILAIIPSAR
jgi:sporulation integral membrane protein YlbJ